LVHELMAYEFITSSYVQSDGTIMRLYIADSVNDFPAAPEGCKAFDRGTDKWYTRKGDNTWAEDAAGGGAPTTADYLVGTADAGLSAEIVVGTSPGGELGGTWGSPTVDATHSGSAHHAQSHGNADHTSTFIAAAGVTYENLDANADVGSGATQVAQGSHSHAGAGHTIADTGSAETQRATLDFQDGFIVTDNSGANSTDVDLDYGSGATQPAAGNHTHVGGGLNTTLVSGASGAANTAAAPSATWMLATADNAVTTVETVMSLTGLAVGTYMFEYFVVWRSGTTTVGTSWAVDYTGTVTRVRATRHYQTTGAAAATGVADGVAATLTGQLVEHMSTMTDNGALGPNTGVGSTTEDQFDHIRGIIVVSTTGDLNLSMTGEGNGAVTFKADSSLFLRRLA
jgi:hypothetical protein